MIKVFNANERVFTSNGDKILHPIKAIIYKEDNGDYELEIETRLEDKEYIVNDKIIVCDTPWGAQGFRVYNPQTKNNKITCTCKHLYYDTAGYLIERADIQNGNCNYAIDTINSNSEGKMYGDSIFTVSGHTEGMPNSLLVEYKTLEQAISDVLAVWGGHLVRDNFNINIAKSIGTDRGVTLRYGKNIEDISVKEDWSKVATRILPIGKDGLTLSEKYVTTADLNTDEKGYGIQYIKPYTKTVTFTQEIDDEKYKTNGVLDEEAYITALLQDLKNQAIAYIRENCFPKVSYSLRANIPLLGSIEQTDIGDKIVVIDERITPNYENSGKVIEGLELETEIISVKWDCIQERYIEVNFGNLTKKLKNLVSETASATKNEVKQAINSEIIPQVEVKLKEAYAEIWDVLDNSYCIYDGDQIIIVDKLPKEQAKNCIKINSAGIAFGKNGIYGAFTSAWTIDGTLNMQSVNVINLLADMIKGGTLKLGNVSAQQGRLELYDSANKLIGEMNESGLTMYATDGGYIKINNEDGFAGYDKNGNKIYWADGDTFCTRKFIANDEVTIGGVLRMLPITTNTNKGIGFVAVYNE